MNICDQPENVVRSVSRLLEMDWQDLDPVYFCLNHFGWFTHIYDVNTGEDLLPKVKEKGFLPQDAEQRDASWLDTYGMVEKMLEDFPDYLHNAYNQYYLYPEYKFSKLDPNSTRADEVMASREKRVFEECKTVIQNGTMGDHFDDISDAHAEMMIEVAISIAFNKNDRYILTVENNAATIIFKMMQWLKLCVNWVLMVPDPCVLEIFLSSSWDYWSTNFPLKNSSSMLTFKIHTKKHWKHLL